MGWMSILTGLLSLANLVAAHMKDEQLLRAGEGRLALKQLRVLNERIEKATAARRSGPADDGLSDDGYRRD